MSDRETLTFNAWKINDMTHKTVIQHQVPPRLYEVKRKKKETPHGEPRKRFLLPQGNGPYSVGSVDVMTDPSPCGSFFRLFYPTKKWNMDRDLAIEFPPWIPSHRYSIGFAKYMSLMNNGNKAIYMQFFEYERKRIFVPTLTDTMLIPEDQVKELPIIIFSHGLSSCRTVSSSICMDWASYGFVVAAVEHRDGSAAYTYHLNIGQHQEKKKSHSHRKSTFGSNHEFTEDGVTYAEHGLLILNVTPFYDYGVRNHQLSHRRREMINCLNALKLLNSGSADDFLLIDPRTGRKGEIKFLKNPGLRKMFKGRLNLSAVTAAGHSFGGATSLVTLIKDKRFKCGVVMDPWTTPLGPEVYERNAFRAPFLMIDSDKWLSAKKQMPLLRCLLADQVRVLAACPEHLGSMICTLKDTNHQSFTDFMLCCGPKLGNLLNLRENKEPVFILQYLRQLSLAFIKANLKLHNVMWPQGSKTILQSVQGGQHLDIKHGHRFIDNHILGYEFEMQRLIAFERQEHQWDRTERPASIKPSIIQPQSPNPQSSNPQSSNRIVAESSKRQPLNVLLEQRESGSGQMSVSATDPEFDEAHSFYLKKSKVSCCSCARNEIRRVSQKRKRLSWSCIVPVGGDDSEIAGATATDININLSGAFWLARATNYPIPICYMALSEHEFNEEAAEDWLNAEAQIHGYDKKNSRKNKGILGLVKRPDCCVMVELGIDSSEPGGIESAAKDVNVQKALAKLTNSLTEVRVEQSRNYWDQTELQKLRPDWSLDAQLPTRVDFRLRRAVLYRAVSGERITSIIELPNIAVVDGCEIGHRAAMILYSPSPTSSSLAPASLSPAPASFLNDLCQHVLRGNALTLGAHARALVVPTGGQISASTSTGFVIVKSSSKLNLAPTKQSSRADARAKVVPTGGQTSASTLTGIVSVRSSSKLNLAPKKQSSRRKPTKSSTKANNQKKRESQRLSRLSKVGGVGGGEGGSLSVTAPKKLSKIDENANRRRSAEKEELLTRHYDEETRLLRQWFQSDPSIHVAQATETNKIKILDFVKFKCAKDKAGAVNSTPSKRRF